MVYLKTVIIFLLIGFLHFNSGHVLKHSDVQENQLEVVTYVNELYVDEDIGPLAATPSITAPVVPGNDLFLGRCTDKDVLLYYDDTAIENSGPSTLNGTLEIYIDAPVRINCVDVFDQISDGTGAVPTFHSGGVGHDFVKITVTGNYGKGFHFKVYVRGVYDDTKKMPLTYNTNNQI